MCLGTDKHRTSKCSSVMFYLLSWVVDVMAIILLWFNMYLFTLYVIYINECPYAKFWGGHFPVLGNGQWYCACLIVGQWRVIPFVRWFSSFYPCDNHPDKESIWGGLSALWPRACLRNSQAFLRSFFLDVKAIIHLYSRLKRNHLYPRKLSTCGHSHQNMITGPKFPLELYFHPFGSPRGTRAVVKNKRHTKGGKKGAKNKMVDPFSRKD